MIRLSSSIGGRGAVGRQAEYDQRVVLVERDAEFCAERRLAVGGRSAARYGAAIDDTVIRLLPHDEVDAAGGQLGVVGKMHGVVEAIERIPRRLAIALFLAPSREIARNHRLPTYPFPPRRIPVVAF